jgi:hypothetical protein
MNNYLTDEELAICISRKLQGLKGPDFRGEFHDGGFYIDEVTNDMITNPLSYGLKKFPKGKSFLLPIDWEYTAQADGYYLVPLEILAKYET